jgi:4-hydroxyacetophenone monooxygenase
VLISAVGVFETPKLPDVPGLGEFGGAAVHSARGPADLDVTGKRVAVVGTGPAPCRSSRPSPAPSSG